MKLSIGMMVKNESKDLERCLQSLKPLRDAIKSELIIVDTGSDDNTVEIAKKYTDKVYFHPWNNDFAEMRNMTISYGKGEWFLVIDADEVLEKTEVIVDFLKSPISKKYGAAIVTVKNLADENDLANFSVLLSPRLFKNNDTFRYEGAVHNQPIFDGLTVKIEASILHYGYMSTDKALMEKKFLRTSAMLKSELEKDPDNIYYWYQLAVTYGMHNDHQEAVSIIEQAYAACKRIKVDFKEYMYIYTGMALMYQLTRNHQKVEEFCLEALTVKEGYIDIYYYLAEAQAVHQKYQESIDNYEKYLTLLEEENETKQDTSIIVYSIGQVELAYYNLSNLYKKVGNPEQALLYAGKLFSKNFIIDNLKNTIFMYIELNKYQELKKYYDLLMGQFDDIHEVFYEMIQNVTSEFSDNKMDAIAEVFQELDNNYGLLCKMILEDKKNAFTDKTIEAIKQLDISKLPIYYGEIIYYLLKQKYFLNTLFNNFQELRLNYYIEYIAKKHTNVSLQIYEYLQTYDTGTEIDDKKISKALCRYALMLDKLTPDQYKVIFDRYIRDGISYIQAVYNSIVIEDKLVYDVKNDEEIFFIYMYHAQCNTNLDSSEYIKYLREALQAFGAMKKGVGILLQQFEEDRSLQDSNNELLQYQKMIKENIKQFINKGDFIQASAVIAEYEQIIANDSDINEMKATIAMAEQGLEREVLTLEKPLQEVKILHGTMEIANQMHALTGGLQKNGYQARYVNYYSSYLGYQGDINIFQDCKTQQEVNGRINKFAKQALTEYDIFHFHFGTSLTLNNSDLPLLKSHGKKVLMNYWGSDVRRLSVAQKYNPYAMVKSTNESKIIQDMKKIAKYITHCVVGDQELNLYVKDYFPNVHILPVAIDIASYCPQTTKANPKPLFVHAPTSPEVKGTKHILRAIEILQQEYDFDFQLIQGMSHEQAKQAYQQADLIIDQILIGSHGVLAVEAMAMGKPVVCWISEYMRDKYFDDLPIIIANPDTITDVLRHILCNMDMLSELGKRGRRYVEKNHDADDIAERLISIYQKL